MELRRATRLEAGEVHVLGRGDQTAPCGGGDGYSRPGAGLVHPRHLRRPERATAEAGPHLLSHLHLLDRLRRAVGHRDLSAGDKALVRIADDADVLVLFGQDLEQPVLRVVRVLVLVHQDVAEGLLPALAGLGEALEHLDDEHQHVVEVDGVRGVEAALVELVHLGDRLVVERRDALAVVGGRDELVLRVRDLRVDAARNEALRILLELLEALPDEPHLVLRVVDREVRAVPEALGLGPEDAAAR